MKMFLTFPQVHKEAFGHACFKSKLHNYFVFHCSVCSLFMAYIFVYFVAYSPLFAIPFYCSSWQLSLRHVITRILWILFLSCSRSRSSSWKPPVSCWLKCRCRFQKKKRFTTVEHRILIVLLPGSANVKYQMHLKGWGCLLLFLDVCIFLNPNVWLEECPAVFVRFSQVYLQLR